MFGSNVRFLLLNMSRPNTLRFIFSRSAMSCFSIVAVSVGRMSPSSFWNCRNVGSLLSYCCTGAMSSYIL